MCLFDVRLFIAGPDNPREQSRDRSEEGNILRILVSSERYVV